MELSVVRRISSLCSNSACVSLKTYNQGHLKEEPLGHNADSEPDDG